MTARSVPHFGPEDIADALLAARMAMRSPKLNSDNPHFHSKFASRDEVLACVLPALHDQGIHLFQGIFDGELQTIVTKSDEQQVLCIYPLPELADPQKFMGATTYASRGSLMLAFALAGEPDDDGNTAATPEPEVDTVEWEFQALYSRAGKRKRKAELAAALGNPATQQEALAAYRAMSEEQRTLAALTVDGDAK